MSERPPLDRSHPLHGLDLRHALLAVLDRARRELSIGELVAALDRAGFHVWGEQANKAVSDALRVERGRRRVVRTRRGVYALARLARTTQWRVRTRWAAATGTRPDEQPVHTKRVRRCRYPLERRYRGEWSHHWTFEREERTAMRCRRDGSHLDLQMGRAISLGLAVVLSEAEAAEYRGPARQVCTLGDRLGPPDAAALPAAPAGSCDRPDRSGARSPRTRIGAVVRWAWTLLQSILPIWRSRRREEAARSRGDRLGGPARPVC